MKHDPLEFVALLEEHNLPIPEAEYKFHSTRKWRFDYYWPEYHLALEVEGGVWINGGHTRGSGFVKNLEKYNMAAMMGIRVIRCEPKHVCTYATIEMINKALAVALKQKDFPGYIRYEGVDYEPKTTKRKEAFITTRNNKPKKTNSIRKN